MGFSRRFTVDRGWVHRLGIPPPWRRISVSENRIAIGSRTAVFTVVRLFSYQTGFFQILDCSLYCTAGERQILCDGFDSRPRLSFFVHSVVKIEVHQLCAVRQIAVFIELFEIRESLVAFLNAAGAPGSTSSVLSFQALGSRGLMVYSPDRKSI